MGADRHEFPDVIRGVFRENQPHTNCAANPSPISGRKMEPSQLESGFILDDCRQSLIQTYFLHMV